MKQYVIKNNFSAGELSPTLYTRTDIQQYGNGAKKLLNVIPLVEGGIRKRPGTFFVNLYENAVRLIPFVVNSDQAYMLILKPLAIDIYDPRTKTVVATVTTPYTTEQIPELQFVQYRYEMFFTHNDVPVQRFRSSTDFTNWEFSEFVYTNAPTDSESARSPFRKGTPSGKEVGSFVSFTLDGISAWVEATTYLVGDVISYNSRLYQALKDGAGHQPDISPTYWAEIQTDTSGFTSADVGSFIDVNGGIIKITEFVGGDQVNGEVLVKLESDIKAIERAWTVLPPAFNSTDGYPRCCMYFKQRLVLANTKKAPNKIWFSAVGGNANFLETTDDGDAFSVVSSSGLANSILFLEAQRGVVCLTSGGEYLVSSDGALTPTTVNINENSAIGTYPLTRPCRVGNEILFIQRGGSRLRALSYRYEVDGLVTPEVSALSSHIGKLHGGINEVCYQQEPESLVWCVLGDGKVASITFNRDQEVIAWANQDFGGIVQSMCSVPTGLGSDLCFMLINRNGTMCLEQVSFDAYLDSQRTVTLESNTLSKDSFSYLKDLAVNQFEGESIFYVSFTETETEIKFQRMAGQTINYGQNIRSEAVLFPPELSQNPASTLLFKAKIDRTAFFFNETLAPELNGELIELFTFDGTPMDSQKPKTGFYLYEGGTWKDLHALPIKITHNKPLPFYLQAIAMQLSINER
ncbi:carbohydrate-binding protein [Acinetobacter baumannii]|uniref:carbohydrate-binding protein n=1 Tax=Acinetobacter baumannii TaxID=470 RepID=UPI001F24E2C6|nr:carbohydrate-binding protein [Acinetobacter baumannii]MDO7394653.1 carbohydrate-binding protein [Acinetobacter baumannii]UJX48827.1 carbohydrate-binding protein [Acinetobacter baumannii]